ncbi:MAG: 30S ribosomal protein S7 [Gemmatimonadaceae bacterium 4484_173]|jgi:small subunit ribosomal protein S7|nr:MAG: 30S ribosomal protein S7 [Gemmatimonadaceae bacterium 4484_173]RKZ05175.1 MAG: 30S ribosomal protein S7 [Candidatus Fermentibacteria bacterium]
MRRNRPKRREILPDVRYGNITIAKFINNIMLQGKKSVAEAIVYGAFDIIAEKTGQDPVSVFSKAMNNVRPTLKVKSRRVGGSTYQIPLEVRPEERDALAMRWIIGFSRKRKGNTMRARLAAEFMDAARNEGASVKKKEDTHKMADANKAFAHYRW